MGKQQKLSYKQIQELHTFINTTARKGPEVRRAQAILLLDQGVDASGIEALTGFHRTRAFILRRRFFSDGCAVLKDRREGQPKELLTKKQREEIITLLKTQPPKDCMSGCESDYWTTSLLGRYIRDTYKVAYKSRTSLYLIFHKATFSYHKPGTVSERRDEAEVEKWRKQVEKQVRNAWHDPDTVILTEDEMHLSNQTTTQKIWLPQGEYPKIEVARKREARSIYGFLNIKTGQQYAFKTKWQNMYITAKILKKIRKLYPRKKILLVWDQAGWHRGSVAQEFIKTDGNIATLYFPTAAPDENPQEHVWKAGRAQVTHNAFMHDIDKTTDKFVRYLNTAQFPYSLLGFSSLS